MVKVYNGDKVRIRPNRGGMLWNGGEVETFLGESGRVPGDYIITVTGAGCIFKNDRMTLNRLMTLNGQPITEYGGAKRPRPPVPGHLPGKLAIMAHKARGTITALDALRGLGMASGTMTKVISRLKHDHGFKVTTVQVRDRITGVRYTRYTLVAPDYSI